MVSKDSSGYQQIGATPSTAVSAEGATHTRVRAVISQVGEGTQAVLARQRPWSELLDRQAFEKPVSMAEATGRMKKNLSYFRTNYIIFTLVLLGLSLLWHPLSLVVLALLIIAWIYFYFSRSEPVVIFGRVFGETEVLIGLAIISIVALFLTQATSALWSAIIISAVMIALHSAFRRPDDLFLEEQDNAAAAPFSLSTNNGASRA